MAINHRKNSHIKKEEINFALIGSGAIAKTHIDAFNSLRETRLRGVLSLSDCKKSLDMANQLGIKSYNSFKEVLNDKDIDAVDIIAKNNLHARLGIAAANCGKHILVEKPIATSLKDADRLIETCKKNKVKLSVISQNRFIPSYINFKKNIEKNKFGKINLAVFSWIIRKNKNYFNSSPWRKSKREAGGGLLIMNLIHYIDLLQWFLGPVFSVYGEIKNFKHKMGVEDTVCAVLKFKNGTLGIGYGTTAASVGFPPAIKIYGTEGSVELIDSDYLITSKDIFAEQIRDFSRAILEDKKPAVDGMDGKNSLRTVLAIYQSARLKKEIFISY